MGKEKKIKLEHLDETLIQWFNHLIHSGVVTFSDLSPELQNSITRGNSGNGSYNDGPIRSELEAINNKKLNKDEARSEYHRKDTPLTIDDMSDNIKEVLRAVREVNIAYKRGIRLSNTPIVLDDLDGSIKNIIQRYEERITELEKKKNSTPIVPVPEPIPDFNNSTSNINSPELAKYKQMASEGLKKADQSLSKIEELKSLIETLKERLNNGSSSSGSSNNNIEFINGKISPELIPKSIARQMDLSELETRINSIINKANPVNGLDGMMTFVTNSDINRTGELRGGNLFLSGVFAETQEELAKFKAKKLPVIISIFDDKIYVTTEFIRNNLITVTTPQNKQKQYGNYAIYSIIETVNELADGQVHSTNPDKHSAEEEDERNFFNFDYTSGGPLTTHWGLNQKFFLDIKTGYVLFNDNGAFINLITGDINYKTTRAVPTVKTIIDATKEKSGDLNLFTSNHYSASNEPIQIPVANNAVKNVEETILPTKTYTYKSLGTKPISFQVWIKNEETGSEYFNKYIKDDTIVKSAIYLDSSGKQCLDVKNLSSKNAKVLIQIYSEV